ncbi:hypothetical protein As57867_024795, partial [Aphanomyces stellatus]
MSGSVKEQVEKVIPVLLEAAEHSAGDVNAHRKLLRSLCSVKITLANATAAQKKEATTTLVRTLMLAIQAYHAKQTGSDCVIQVFCDVLEVAYDGSAVSECMDVLVSKTSTLGAKLTVARAMAQWTYAQLHSASGYIPELMSLGGKHTKHVDMAVRHTLVASLARALTTFESHGVMHHPDAIKLAAKFITDKSPEIRAAVADLLDVVLAHTEPSDMASLDALFGVLAKALDDPAPDVRRAMAIHMGTTLSRYVVVSVDSSGAATATPGGVSPVKKPCKPPGPLASVDAAITFIKDAFGATSGVGGVFSSCAIMVATLCARCVDALTEPMFHNLVMALLSFLDLALPSANEYVRARNAVGFAFRGVAKTLNERDQHQWLRVVLATLDEPTLSHHQRLVLVVECSHLFHALGEASVVYAAPATVALGALLGHEKHSVRLEAAVALASLAVAVPYRRQAILDVVLTNLERAVAAALPPSTADTAALYALQGLSAALTHVFRMTKLDTSGFSVPLYDRVLGLAETMVASQFQPTLADPIWLTCTRAGWDILGALVAMHAPFTRTITTRLCGHWTQALAPQAREPAQELLRLEGAVVALYSWLVTSDASSSSSTMPLVAQLLHGTLASVHAMGVPSKQRAKVAKHRVVTWLLKCFACVPMSLVADSWISLLDFVAEFTTAQPLTSLARSSLVPPATTYLSSADQCVAPVRLVAGDGPDPMYSKELNLVLCLLQTDTALSDTELEAAYVDAFWGHSGRSGAAPTSSSPFTYVRMVDACVALFPTLFLALPDELQLRALQHFAGVLADPKISMDGVVNVSAMLLATTREAQLTSRRLMKPAAYHGATWPLTIQSMLLELVASNVDVVRRSAADALGITASLLSDPHIRVLVADLEAKVTGHRDDAASPLLAGSALALAHLKRSCGSRCAVDISLLYALNQDHVFSLAQPLRTWSLHAWSLLLECVNTSGDYDEQYVAPSLALIELQFLAGFRFPAPSSSSVLASSKKHAILRGTISVCVAIGQVLNSIVSALGPELVTGNVHLIDQLYALWDLLRMTPDPRVELEYLRFVEQLVLFAPSYFKATDLARIKRLVCDPATAPECRSIMLLILRILVERDPSLIHAEGLHLALFQALDAHEAAADWTQLPLLRGLHATGHTRQLAVHAVTEVQGCLTALLVTECGVQRLENGNKACEWLLFCRGIAVGGVTSIPPTESPRHNGSESGDAFSSAADLWRRTNARVCDTLNDVPCLHRRVREFAAHCVLAVLALVAKSPVAAIHFDVARTRDAIAASKSLNVNFVSLYVDELVTLACQLSAFSMDGFELQTLQSVGLTLLNVVCDHFATAVDPDVPDETILVQYQAQLSSTIRRAFAVADPPLPSPSPFAFRSAAPPSEHLRLEGAVTVAHVLANKIVADKVAVPRLLKFILLPDYHFDASMCDDVLRFRLSLTTLAAVARLSLALPPSSIDAAAYAPMWQDAVRDFCLLHVAPPAGAGEFSGAYFRTTADVDALKTTAIAHAPVLVAALAALPASDKRPLLTAALLFFAAAKPTDSVAAVLATLPSLLEWSTMDAATYDNVLETLLLLATHADDAVQLAALRALQLLVTKDGAAFVKTLDDAMTRDATLHQLHVATTVVLRAACTKRSARTDPALVL